MTDEIYRDDAKPAKALSSEARRPEAGEFFGDFHLDATQICFREGSRSTPLPNRKARRGTTEHNLSLAMSIARRAGLPLLHLCLLADAAARRAGHPVSTPYPPTAGATERGAS